MPLRKERTYSSTTSFPDAGAAEASAITRKSCFIDPIFPDQEYLSRV
jgi:hypothetical protein